jgi:hypothetical protein
MRPALSCLLFLISSSAVLFGQPFEGPSDFADVPFGSDPETVQAILCKRPNVRFSKPEKSANGLDKLVFTGGTFAGLPVDRWDYFFVGGKFALGQVKLVTSKSADYTKLKQEVMKKYGSPKGHRPKGSTSETYWTLAQPGDKKRTSTVALIPYKASIVLEYRDDTLYDSPHAEIGAKAVEDL